MYKLATATCENIREFPQQNKQRQIILLCNSIYIKVQKQVKTKPYSLKPRQWLLQNTGKRVIEKEL